MKLHIPYINPVFVVWHKPFVHTRTTFIAEMLSREYYFLRVSDLDENCSAAFVDSAVMLVMCCQWQQHLNSLHLEKS